MPRRRGCLRGRAPDAVKGGLPRWLATLEGAIPSHSVNKNPHFFYASLIINLTLVVALAHRGLADKGRAVGDERSYAPRALVAAGLSPETRGLLERNEIHRLGELKEGLLADGVPADDVYALIASRIDRVQQRMITEADPRATRPWWQRTTDRLPGEDVKLGRLELRLWSERRRILESLFPGRRMVQDQEGLSSVPESKRDSVRRIIEACSRSWNAVYDDAGGFPTKPDRGRLQQIDDERERELRAALSPSEYAEFILRSPSSARYFKEYAAQLNLSEEQFRSMIEISEWASAQRRTLDAAEGASIERTPGYLTALEQIDVEKAAQLEQILGEEKYRQYLRLDDFEYKDLVRLVARLDLPTKVVDDYLVLAAGFKAEFQRVPMDTSEREYLVAVAALAGDYRERVERVLGREGVKLGTGLNFVGALMEMEDRALAIDSERSGGATR